MPAERLPAGVAPPARVAVFDVQPSVQGGRYPAKRTAGDTVRVGAAVCVDGHDEIRAQLLHRRSAVGAPTGWESLAMTAAGGDRFAAQLSLDTIGTVEFVVEAWVDDVATWERRITRKRQAGLSTDLDEVSLHQATAAAGSEVRVRSGTHFITVGSVLAGCGAWYEFFPRSTVVASDDQAPSRHGTLLDAVGRLDAVAEMGFDIVYLPPIHPIGRSHRKGPNNTLVTTDSDVGSPWAIGDRSGGHTAIHQSLGTEADLVTLVAEANTRGIEVALDLAFQCSPDHPWISEHPEWFEFRPDGTIACAENPPKRYEDIVPFNFDTPRWRELWQALADVVRHWHRLGIRVFRVDNPHTKPFPFWEWMIATIHADDPGVIFLAEAFASPTVMLQLAKVGFTQSYTHFPWQHSPSQIRDYFTTLTTGEAAEHFRACSWPNTPDILTAELQQGLRASFVERLVLAGTLSASYGIYGPPFETMASVARGSAEEYVDSEKYQLSTWSSAAVNLTAEITLVNQIRRRFRALHHDRTLRFHHCDNERIVVYSKTSAHTTDTTGSASRGADDTAADAVCDDPIVVVASTDQWNVQVGTVTLDLDAFGPGPWDRYHVVDVFGGHTYEWSGAHNGVILDPNVTGVHILQIRALP